MYKDVQVKVAETLGVSLSEVYESSLLLPFQRETQGKYVIPSARVLPAM